MDENSSPKTWLAESILVTIFCFQPFGIVGIVHSARASALYQQGRFEEAERARKTSKKWMSLGFFIGMAIVLAYIFIVVMALLFSALASYELFL